MEDLSRKFFLLLLCLTPSVIQSENSPRDYFKACQSLQEEVNRFNDELGPSHPLHFNSQVRSKKPPCRSYQCLSQSDDLDLEKLRDFQCNVDQDCAQDISGMICKNHSVVLDTKYCSCPPGHAYSTVECRCKPAELCWSNQDPCHKGMKCQDHKCSCKNLDHLLYEIHGGFCIEPRSTHFGLDHFTQNWDDEVNETANRGPEVIAVAVLASILILGLIAIGLYAVSVKRQEIDFCARGDYVCDTIAPGNRQNQPHVAAWDAPSMDFLSEEQTLKYLNRSSSVAEVTKSPSVATTAELVDEAPSPSGSLPECEQGTRKIVTVETNFDNPTFNGISRNSSESTTKDEDENEEAITRASNIL